MEIKIREGSLEDAKSIYEITKYGLGYEYSVEEIEKKLDRILNDKSYIVLVAEIDKNIVGYIQGHGYESLYQKSLMDIMALAVLPKYQNIGIGRALISKIESLAKEEYSGLRLVTRSSRLNAHKFYERVGFKEQKLQKNFKKYFN